MQGAKFLSMISRHFPANHPLHKIFIRNTVKVSYATTRNIKRHIAKHNNTVINKNKETSPNKICNCRNKPDCLFRGECLEGPLIYEATVKTENETKKYIGSARSTFKDRYYGHTHSLEHRHVNSTALSTYIWKLRDKGKFCETTSQCAEGVCNHSLTWNIKAKTGVYNTGAKFCDNCLTEKTYILLADPTNMLNVRTEILNKCRHMLKFTLGNI